jgi:hypothetical protein
MEEVFDVIRLVAKTHLELADIQSAALTVMILHIAITKNQVLIICIAITHQDMNPPLKILSQKIKRIAIGQVAATNELFDLFFGTPRQTLLQIG